MIAANTPFKSGNQLSARSVTIWRVVQFVVWLVGLAIFLSLIYFPSIGLLVFWNILIPIAPALFVVAAGLWRNVCPIAITNLLPRHFDLSLKMKISVRTQAKLQLVSILVLYAVVPLRHAIFNNDGMATAWLLFIAVTVGFSMGFVYDWKSGWCSTLCPVHPVEKLYGGNTLISMPNAHCGECVNCSVPCPDSTPNMHPAMATKTVYHKISGILTIGGLPGFIWGWFHVPDNNSTVSLSQFFGTYELPLLGCLVTLIIYLIWDKVLAEKDRPKLIAVFAAAGVSCYYWYRIPALLGFGKFAEDGVLINLKNILPEWSIILMIISTTIFFFSWFLLRKPNSKSWVVRPKFAWK